MVFDGTAFESWVLYCNDTLLRKMNAEWKQDGTSPIRYADITEAVHEGENTLRFFVKANEKGDAAAIGRLLLRDGENRESLLKTDEEWKIRREGSFLPAAVVGAYGDEPWGKPKRRGPAPLLRKEFSVEGTVRRASLYICGLGYEATTLNGQPVGESVLRTEYSQFHKRVYYHTLDVTPLVKPGKNCLGVELGRGYYSYHKDWVGIIAEQDEPKLLLQLVLWLENGDRQTIVSDQSWKTIDGPTLDDNIWYGEKVDARLLPASWEQPGFDDSGWKNVRLMSPPGGKLCAFYAPPVRITEKLKPAGIHAPGDRIYVYDFGRTVSGWAEICVNERPGTRLKLTYGEKLLENGRVDMQNEAAVFQFWEPAQCDIYICRGGGKERWAPKFSYKGFRYVEVEGADHEISITAKVFHNDLKRTGRFSCSNELFNRIHRLITPTILNNFHSIPTDTPAYEKRGWTGDAQLICEAALTNLDAQAFFRKWLRDLSDSQNEDGAVPETCPGPTIYSPAPEWMCAMVMIPYQLYYLCGDEAALRQYYPSMARYADYEIRRLKDGLSSNLYYGDWNSPAGTRPPEGDAFNATCYVFRVLSIVEESAHLLGKESDAVRYGQTAREISRTLNSRFLDTSRMLYHTEVQTDFRQTPTVLPLAFGIVPLEKRVAIARSLAEKIRVQDHSHLSTGCMGLKYLAPVLTSYGQKETAFAVVSQTDFPSWGYWLTQGATTLWEAWDKDSRSYDHYYFGTIDDWFYQYLAGIRPTSAGFRTFQIKPYPCGDLKWVDAREETPYGAICVHWQLENGMFSLKVAVPVNTEAEIVLPSGQVFQSGSGRHLYQEKMEGRG